MDQDEKIQTLKNFKKLLFKINTETKFRKNNKKESQKQLMSAVSKEETWERKRKKNNDKDKRGEQVLSFVNDRRGLSELYARPSNLTSWKHPFSLGICGLLNRYAKPRHVLPTSASIDSDKIARRIQMWSRKLYQVAWCKGRGWVGDGVSAIAEMKPGNRGLIRPNNWSRKSLFDKETRK